VIYLHPLYLHPYDYAIICAELDEPMELYGALVWGNILHNMQMFGGIPLPRIGDDETSPPASMVNHCPLCQKPIKRGSRTSHLTTVHKRSREEAKSLIEKYCGNG
jgi:hypothetical protein